MTNLTDEKQLIKSGSKASSDSATELKTSTISVGKKMIIEETDEWLKEKKKMITMFEVSLILDTYEDLFSDFDPRPFSQRALSFDFLSEMQRATREDVNGVVELKLMIPEALRNSSEENLIKKRLKEHFRKHHEQGDREVLEMRISGLKFVVVGFLVALFGGVVLNFVVGETGFWHSSVLYLLEPAAWFTIWTGLEKIFTAWTENKDEIDFYKKMASAEIVFVSY
jgi:hypothetical protein